jgi:hypothetical protein
VTLHREFDLSAIQENKATMRLHAEKLQDTLKSIDACQ